MASGISTFGGDEYSTVYNDNYYPTTTSLYSYISRKGYREGMEIRRKINNPSEILKAMLSMPHAISHLYGDMAISRMPKATCTSMA